MQLEGVGALCFCAHPSPSSVFNIVFSGKEFSLALCHLVFSLLNATKFPGGKFKTTIYPETDVSFILILLVGDFLVIIESLVLAVCCEDSLVLSKSTELFCRIS